jgi:hypothetical protein
LKSGDEAESDSARPSAARSIKGDYEKFARYEERPMTEPTWRIQELWSAEPPGTTWIGFEKK